MKKIFILLLTILTVVLSVPVTAAERSFEDILHDEIIQLIDIKQYGADENDEGIYLISVMESGYTEKGFSDQTALYVYLYNPSMKKITSSDLNAISMATEYNEDGKPVDFKKYRLQVEGSTSGGLYIRAKVAASAKTLAHVKDGVRWYGVSELELREDSNYGAEAYEVGYVYKFSGTGSTLKGECESFLTITLSNIGQTSYLTGDSALGKGYSNQIASVYFSIPQEIEKKYGALYSVDYQYYRYRTAPMLMIEDNNCYDFVKEALNGSLTKNFTLYVDKGYQDDLGYFVSPIFWLFPGVDDKEIENYYDSFPLVFDVTTLEAGEELVSSETLKNAFFTYTDSDLYGSLLKKVNGKYSQKLFDLSLYSENDHKIIVSKTRDDVFDLDSYGSTHKWYEKVVDFGIFYWVDDVFGENEDTDLEDVKFIQSITESDCYASDFSSAFLVSKNDSDTLAQYCKAASLKQENVYLLRFAYTDNYAYNIYEGKGYEMFLELEEDGEEDDTQYPVAVIQEDVYLDFDFISLGFSDDGQEVTTFGVVASPIDVFPSLDGIDVGGGDDVELKELLQKIVAVFLIVVLVGVVIWLIGLFGKLGQASTNRQILRELRRRKKK